MPAKFVQGGTDGGGIDGNGLPSTVVTKTSNYTAAAGELVRADAVAGGFTVTLPVSPATGALVIVKKVDTTGSTVAVVASDGGSIDGDADGASITSPQFGAVFEHIGSNAWLIVAPTSSGGSNGASGTRWFSGSGAPSDALGGDGDYYLRDTGLVYAKALGAWGATSINLIGATGAAGANGSNGAISTIQEEGSDLAVRGKLNFIGAGVTAADDAANGRTNVTISAAAGTTGYYGDGSDGNVTITGTTTLTRDMFYDQLTVQSGGVLVTAGYRVHCKTSCTVQSGGVINTNGRNATGAGAQVGAGASASLGGGRNSGGGATGVGTVGSDSARTLGGAGGAGGSGGSGAGAAGGAAVAPTASLGGIRSVLPAYVGSTMFGANAGQTIQAGAGGGGGTGDGTISGGGGGSGAGYIVLTAKALVHNGSIEAKGGNGFSTASGNTGGGGGGGGGLIVLIYGTKSGSGTTNVAGGTPGTGSGTGTSGVAGGAGTVLEFVA